jgi:hypothetical protein
MPGGNIRFREMPKMNAGPYIKRALKLLKGHMGFVAVSFVLSLIMCLLPFVAAAAMGPIFKLFGQAAQGGDWSKVWSMTSSFYDTSTDGAGPGWFPPAFIRNWLSTPLTFTTIFIIWTVSLVFRNVIDILRAWIEANLERHNHHLRPRLRSHSIAVARFLHGRNRGVDAESSCQGQERCSDYDTGPGDAVVGNLVM